MVPYIRHSLAIMIRAGNPTDIRSLLELGRADVAVSMPSPQTERIAQKVVKALEKAGGYALVHAVMDRKVELGTTFITRIRHRQTPT